MKVKTRGVFVLLQGWFAIRGIVLATWLEFGLYYVNNSSVNWRFPIAFQALFALVFMSVILSMPESPRWLLKRDLIIEATNVVSALEDLASDSPLVTESIAVIRENLAEELRDGNSKSPWALNHN
jgi:hypothetical protein